MDCAGHCFEGVHHARAWYGQQVFVDDDDAAVSHSADLTPHRVFRQGRNFRAGFPQGSLTRSDGEQDDFGIGGNGAFE